MRVQDRHLRDRARRIGADPRRWTLTFSGALMACTLLCAGNARAFVLQGSPWPTHTITYYNAAGASQQAVADAVRAWNHSGARVRFVATPRPRARLLITTANGSTREHTDSDDLGVATVGWPHGGQARVWLVSPRRTAEDHRAPLDRDELAQVAAHELGHVIGLGHERRGCADMNPALNSHCRPPQPWQQRCRVLEPDDIAGAIALYGGHINPLPPRYCDATIPARPPSQLTAERIEGHLAVQLRWINPPGVTIAPRVRFSLDEIAEKASIEQTIVNWAPNRCVTLSTASDVFSVKPAVAGSEASTVVHLPQPSRWCFTVGTVDVFGRLGASVNVWLELTPQ